MDTACSALCGVPVATATVREGERSVVLVLAEKRLTCRSCVSVGFDEAFAALFSAVEGGTLANSDDYRL